MPLKIDLFSVLKINNLIYTMAFCAPFNKCANSSSKFIRDVNKYSTIARSHRWSTNNASVDYSVKLTSLKFINTSNFQACVFQWHIHLQTLFKKFSNKSRILHTILTVKHKKRESSLKWVLLQMGKYVLFVHLFELTN